MPLAVKQEVDHAWNNASHDLGWLKGGPIQNNWADAYGLIWHKEPMYCAGAVHITDKEYCINTTGWHGMKAEDKKSLEAHLESLSLTPMIPETVT